MEAQEAVEAEAKLRRLSAQLAEAEAELAEAEAGGAAGEKVNRDPVRIEAARRAAEELRAEHAIAQADALRERQEAEQAAADAIRESSSSSRGRFYRPPA
eukprot:COSAG01_NODE_3540_length_5957_cov_540.355241_5_plen_100_part_00